MAGIAAPLRASRPDVSEALDKQGMVPTPGKADTLGMMVKNDLVRWADVIKRARISAD
jgi:hypothetical protein